MITKVIISPNEYLRNKAVDNKIKNKNDVVYLEKPNDHQLLTNISELPPYGSIYRIVVVYGIDELSTNKDFLVRVENKSNDMTICYFVLPKLPKNPLGEWLSKKPITKIDAPKNKKEVRQYVKKLKYTLDNPAFDLFYSMVGDNPYYIDNELAKLAKYGEITREIVETYCYNYTKLNPFNQATKILTSKDKKYRIAYLAEYYQNSDDLYGLVNALYYKTKQVLQYKTLEAQKQPKNLIIEQLGIKQWTINEVSKIGQIFDYKRLYSITLELAKMKLTANIDKLKLINLLGVKQ